MAEKPPAVSGKDVVVHVPKGQGGSVKVNECDNPPAEITVQVSKERKAEDKPMLGVIVK